MKARLRALIEEALRRAVAEGELPEGEFPSVALEYPPEERFGDYATNLALVLAPRFKLPPREVATRLLKHLEGDDFLARVEVAGPGFVNFFLKDEVWFEALREACLRGEGYGRCEVGKGRRVLVEFVSANPTGPLHIGHGRIAAFGDTLSRVLELAGWRVEREYYINDIGTQMELLGRSVYARYRELLGEESTFPEDGYRGDYIFEIARVLTERHGRGLLERPEEEAVKVAASEAEGLIMSWIREDLERFGVTFDHYFRESSLYEGGEVQRVLDELKGRGLLYERDGALWFKSSAFGDEKDRVVVRASGATTYFASDIAYHVNKLRRGYEVLVD
ncbi:MAG: arginine--tRNA ligase, partial [Deltaproteobacteria bacterium]